MGIPTRACINGLTKEDTERLKNALIKKIEDNETTVNVTEDGKVIVADNSGFYLSYDGNIIGLIQDESGDYIPTTEPYLPEDENENPLVPPSETIMTSDNIAVDPRIVRTTGNQNIAGNKVFTGYTFIDNPRIKMSDHFLSAGEWRKYYEYTPVSYGGYAIFSVIQTYYVYAWRGAEIRIRQGTPSSNMDGNMYGFSNTLLGCLAKRTDGVVELWLNNPSSSNSVGVRLSVVAESGGSIKVASGEGSKPVVGDNYTYVYDIPQN